MFKKSSIKSAASYSFAQLQDRLLDFENRFPALVRKIKIGESVAGRDLWVMQITDNPGIDEGEPEVAFIGSMHGNEWIATVVLLNAMEYLLDSYGQDSEITNLINSREIWFFPMMNPDGVERNRRWNDHNVDLNRNFKVFDDSCRSFGDLSMTEPETQAWAHFSEDHHFSVAANYHSGAQVVNYLWDVMATPTFDEALLIDMALEYAQTNPEMLSGGFSQGITNGYDWYQVCGSIQDWAYDSADSLHFTMEVSQLQNNFSDAEISTYQVPVIFRVSFRLIRWAGYQGVSGIVRDKEGPTLGRRNSNRRNRSLVPNPHTNRNVYSATCSREL